LYAMAKMSEGGGGDEWIPPLGIEKI